MGRFLIGLDNPPRMLSPETTQLEADFSARYNATQLYIDALLQSAPSGDYARIHQRH